MMKEHRQIDLENYELFNALSLSDRERLRPLFHLRSFSRNEVIFLKGDPGDGLFLICSGRVKICVVDRQGSELVFTFLVKGDLLGELAIIDGKPRSAAAIAVENTATLYLDRKEFLEFLGSSPQACIEILNVLCQRLRRLSGQMEEISFLNVAGRIARNLTATANLASPSAEYPGSQVYSITQEELARVIGASREMVNKVLNSFVDLGLISITRKKLTLLNVQELNRIAGYEAEN